MNTTYYTALQQAIKEFNIDIKKANEISVEINQKFIDATTKELIFQTQKELIKELNFDDEIDCYKAYIIGCKVTLNLLELESNRSMNHLVKKLGGLLT